MWLSKPRTSNSEHGVGDVKSAGATPLTFWPANVVARSIRSIGSIPVPSFDVNASPAFTDAAYRASGVRFGMQNRDRARSADLVRFVR
jgi:hypothetical protein